MNKNSSIQPCRPYRELSQKDLDIINNFSGDNASENFKKQWNAMMSGLIREEKMLLTGNIIHVLRWNKDEFLKNYNSISKSDDSGALNILKIVKNNQENNLKNVDSYTTEIKDNIKRTIDILSSFISDYKK